MGVSKLCLDVFYVKLWAWGFVCLWFLLKSLWLLKRVLELLITNPMTLSEVYMTTLSIKNLICPQGVTYIPCPEGWGFVILKDIISGSFNYVEQNGYLKILIWSVWGNDGSGGLAFALWSLSTSKKDTSSLNLKLNEPFLKFLRQRFL